MSKFDELEKEGMAALAKAAARSGFECARKDGELVLPMKGKDEKVVDIALSADTTHRSDDQNFIRLHFSVRDYKLNEETDLPLFLEALNLVNLSLVMGSLRVEEDEVVGDILIFDISFYYRGGEISDELFRTYVDMAASAAFDYMPPLRKALSGGYKNLEEFRDEAFGG